MKNDSTATKVLLVEDDPDDALLVREAIDGAGTWKLRLQFAERLQEGLHILAEGGTDVVLLDLSLPDSRGFETFERTYAQAPEVPIVILTGLSDEDLATRVVRSGAQAYLLKQELQAGALRRTLRHAIERKRLEEQLRKSQRMEAVGKLAGGIAHDFNNLLTVIIGYSELLMGRVAGDESLRKSVARIKEAGEQGCKLINQLMTFSRQEAPQAIVLNLNEVVGRMDTLLRPVIGRNIKFVTRLAPDLGGVRCGSGQLEQVLMNLAVNARDAMPKGGTVTIETTQATLTQEDADRNPGVKAGPHAVLMVKDTGQGMDAQVLAHLFEPFFTTKEAGKGTGLGLATVYQIVQQSGGHISVSSEVGKGSMFQIYLPMVETEAEVAA